MDAVPIVRKGARRRTGAESKRQTLRRALAMDVRATRLRGEPHLDPPPVRNDPAVAHDGRNGEAYDRAELRNDMSQGAICSALAIGIPDRPEIFDSKREYVFQCI